MAFVIIFWTTYIPFVVLLLSLVRRYAMRALRGLRFERLLGGNGTSPGPSVNRPASAHVGLAQQRAPNTSPRGSLCQCRSCAIALL